VVLDRRGIGELRRGDGVAADHFERETETHYRRKRHPPGRDRGRDQQRHYDPDGTGSPLDRAPEEVTPLAREQEGRKDSGHEEDEGVQQGQDPQTIGRLVEQVSRKSRGALPYRRVVPARVHESDVLVHAETPLLP
jgi:hypothetical protein